MAPEPAKASHSNRQAGHQPAASSGGPNDANSGIHKHRVEPVHQDQRRLTGQRIGAAESAAESPAQGDMAATLSKRQQQMQLQQQSRTSGDKIPSFMRTKRPTDLRIQQAGFLIPLFYLRESQIVSQSLGEWNLSNHEQALIDGS